MAQQGLPRGLTLENGRYRIRFNSRHTNPGKRYRERLPEGTSRRKAEEHLTYLKEQDRRGELIWPSERLKRSATQYEQEYEMPSVGEYAIGVYIPDCEVTDASATIRTKKQQLSATAPWFWDVPLDQVDRRLVLRYQRERHAEKVSARTVNLGWTTIHHLLNHAHAEGLIDPPPKVKRVPERDKRVSVVLSEDEAMLALENPAQKGAMWHALTMFLLHTGGRWGETRQLRWENLDLENALVTFPAETAKNGKMREVPLLPEVVSVLDALPRACDEVFVRRHCRTGEWIRLRKDPRSNGRKYPWQSPNGELCVGPHTFRHTFATWKLRAGVPMPIVKALLGHSTIQITVDKYSHINPADCREQMEKGPRPQVSRLRLISNG